LCLHNQCIFFTFKIEEWNFFIYFENENYAEMCGDKLRQKSTLLNSGLLNFFFDNYRVKITTFSEYVNFTLSKFNFMFEITIYVFYVSNKCLVQHVMTRLNIHSQTETVKNSQEFNKLRIHESCVWDRK